MGVGEDGRRRSASFSGVSQHRRRAASPTSYPPDLPPPPHSLHPHSRQPPAVPTAQGDIKDDPFYRLVFPTMDMLAPHHRATLLKARAHARTHTACISMYAGASPGGPNPNPSPNPEPNLEQASEAGDPFKLKETVDEIREDLNPHPAGQKALNAPKKEELTGPERSPTAPVARPLARGELLGLRGAPLPLPCSCRREGWWRPGAGPKSPIPLRLSTQAQVLGDRALLPRGRPDVPCLLHLLLPLGAVHRRLRPALCTEGRWVALHLPR
eukprot:scaffold90236_cov48-Phaeocystis_antarctica.AAC.1